MTDMPSALAPLAECIGAGRVLIDDDARTLYGQDVSGDAQPITAVVRPADMDDLIATVRFAAEHDFVIAPRGGGMSYSGGYVCSHERTLCLDMAAMGEVVEINAEDMYVRVQAGCTWKALHEALEPHGLRTPFWGTLSGIGAASRSCWPMAACCAPAPGPAPARHPSSATTAPTSRDCSPATTGRSASRRPPR